MDDLEFLRHCLNGEARYWDEFVDKYSRLIYSSIHGVLRLKGCDDLARDSINDLFQGVFLRLRENNFKKLKSFKALNGCSLATWLRQVAINHTYDHLRRIKPLVSLDDSDGDTVPLREVIPDEASSGRDILVDKEKIVHLKECVEALDTDARYFLELLFGRGLSLEDLKGVFGVSRGAVDMRKARIMERLRDCFKIKGYTFR